nr:hypothetical protein [uncultured Cohaesibacter sp.]
MEVIVIGVEQADQFICEAFGQCSDELQGQARKVLRLFHDRHIGIPAQFALDVAKGFAARFPEVSNHVRLAVYRRLLDALEATPTMKQDPRQFDHISRPLFFDICLLPMASMIIEELGATYLFSTEHDCEPISGNDYQDFVAQFEAMFLVVTDSEQSDSENGVSDKWMLFWARAGHQLWGELQRVRHGGEAVSAQVFSRAMFDDVLLRLISGLDPKPRLPMNPGEDSFSFTDEQNAHLAHPKQGGVVGIHTTSRLEDIEDMLLSEMVLPPPLLADKLLNASFFARHRPPPLDQKQQVMILGASTDDGDNPVIALAKACWLEAVFRMAIVLYKNDLKQSKIRFGQWRKQSGVVTSSINLGDYKHLQALDPVNVSRMQLHRFFCDAGWLPGFLSMMPSLGGHKAASPSGVLFGHGKEVDLRAILESLFPEASGANSEDVPDLSSVLVVVIRQARVGAGNLALTGARYALPTFCLTISCPDQLRGGERIYIEDDAMVSSSLPIPGEAGKPLSREALDSIASDLIARIFQFYWERVNG